MRNSTIFAAAAVLTLSATAWAAPSVVRTSIMGDAASSMGVAWSTYSGTAEAQIKYGTVKGSLTLNAKGIVSKVSSTLGSVSEVTLTNLSPNSTYYYKVGGVSGGWSQEYSFRTGPKPHKECGKVNFVVFGDSRAETWEGDKGSSDTWGKISVTAAKHNPLFFLHGGDIVYDGKKQKQWYNHLKRSSAVSHKVPIMYAIGNHDDGPGEGDAANYNRIFLLPRSLKTLGGSGTEDYYAFTAGPVIVASVSTEGFSKGTPKFKEQADWLDKVLTQNPKRWKFVIMHRPIYTEKGLFGHAPNEAGHNAAFVKVINKHHVDAVFAAHNHFYERWTPSKCSNPASTKVCPSGSYDTGTVFITTGGGGAFPIIVPGFTNKNRLKVSGEHHYIHFEINSQTLKFTTLNGSGKKLDTATWSKKVSTPDPCALPPQDAGAPSDLASGADSASPTGDSSGTADLPPGGDSAGSNADKAGTQQDTGAAGGDKGQVQQDSGGGGTTPGDDGCSCGIGAEDPSPSFLLVLLAALLGSWIRCPKKKRRRSSR